MMAFLHEILSGCERKMRILGEKWDARVDEEGTKKADCPCQLIVVLTDFKSGSILYIL